MNHSERLHVVAAAIVREGRVFLSKRAADAHRGGLWEFPGGKVEAGESAEQAIRRELREEADIDVSSLRPLIQVPYDYPERKVLLDVWLVSAWQREPRGAEGQEVAWVDKCKLEPASFPEANAPVLTALGLPSIYLITPAPSEVPHNGLRILHQCLKNGVRLVQLRSSELEPQVLRPLVIQYAALCKSYGARLLVSSRSGLRQPVGADGVHLTSTDLVALAARPGWPQALVGASCHDRAELQRALAIGADFAVLGPVAATPSHPGAGPLGWERFAELIRDCPIPVYALGGLCPDDLAQAWASGAQGIAGISRLWQHFGRVPEPGNDHRAAD